MILFLPLFMLSCKKDKEVVTIDLGYNYYPVDSGFWRIYDVDSIVHDDFTQTVIKYNYQIKEILTEEFVDSDGSKSIRLERYYRKSESEGWKIKDVWTVRRTTKNLQIVEENQRIVKLIFPVKEGEDWNGNAYNSTDEQTFELLSKDVTETINSIVLDSVCAVLELNNDNFIEYQYRSEKYARNIGLVEKIHSDLDLQKDSAGFELKYSIHSWGK